jgi:hypothetical protein
MKLVAHQHETSVTNASKANKQIYQNDRLHFERFLLLSKQRNHQRMSYSMENGRTGYGEPVRRMYVGK